MENIANTLAAKMGANTPILLCEIMDAFPNLSTETVYRRIRKAVASTELIKACSGIYYVPTKTRFGLSTLGDEAIVKKKYLSNGSDIYGYVTGLALENRVGISNQVPGTLEIVTNRETTRSRKIKPIAGYREVILKKPRVAVTEDNVKTLELLDLITYAPIAKLDKHEFANLRDFTSNIDRLKLLECAQSYPQKTAAKLLESEVLGVFT